MNIFDLSAKITLDSGGYESGIEKAQKQTSGFSDKLKSGLATAGKVAAVGIGAASAAIIALGKIGTEYNTQMETYTTNFKVMLGDEEKAVQKVEELKKFAASTPLAMDDLAKGTQTLLAFGVASEDSTAILQQLGDISLGNADKMQSLATAFGKATAAGKVSGDTVQMMVDAGWNPLIQISKAAGETMEETQKRMSAGKVSVDELNAAMTAVTSTGGQFAGGMKEASKTTAGLMSTLQDNAKALVGEVFQPISDGLLQNLLPTAISSIDQLSTAFEENGITGLVNAAGEIIGNVITTVVSKLPEFITLAQNIIQSIGGALTENIPVLADSAIQVVSGLATFILDNLPSILQAGIELLAELANGIAEALPELIPVIYDCILQIYETLTDPSNIGMIIDAAIAIITGLANGLIDALPELIEKAPVIISNLVTAIVENAPKLLKSSFEIIKSLVVGIIENLPQIGEAAGKIIGTIVKGIEELISNIWDIGKNIVSGIWNGIKEKADWLKDKVKGFFTGIVDNVKDVLGIHSPSKVFTQIGEFLMLGLHQGIRNEESGVYNDIMAVADNIKRKATDKVNELNSALEKATKESQKNVLRAQIETIEKFSDEFDKSVSEIEKKTTSMYDKLRGYGDLFTTVQNEDGAEYLELSDLQSQINAIEQYGMAMERLKARGTPESLMQNIVGMSVDDATKYTNKLLTMTDEEYNKYIALWEKKQKLSADVSKAFYSNELSNLANYFVDKVPEKLGGLKDELYNVGKQAAKSLSAGLQTARIDFAASSQGLASAGIVNGITATQPSAGGTTNVNLVLPDGTKIASYLLNPLINAARQNGTPIANPVV